jgi:hypothetical protein
VLTIDALIVAVLENVTCGLEIKKFVEIVMKSTQENPGSQKKERAND